MKKFIGIVLIIIALVLFIVAPVQYSKDSEKLSYGGMVTLVVIGVVFFIVGCGLIIYHNKKTINHKPAGAVHYRVQTKTQGQKLTIYPPRTIII